MYIGRKKVSIGEALAELLYGEYEVGDIVEVIVRAG
jgi:hypothetical protein